MDSSSVMALSIRRTNDTDIGRREAPATRETIDQVADYLNENPRHAVIVEGVFTTATHGVEREWWDQPVAVFRGASDLPDNFYIQGLPLDDPNDADGGDLTAEQALREAIVGFDTHN